MNKLGALWLKTSKEKGTKFMSGSIEIGGTKQQIVVFKNERKLEDKHPDYIIYESENREQPKKKSTEDEVPF